MFRDAEVGCGIVCGCLPVFPAFFRHFRTKGSGVTPHINTHLREKVKGSSSFSTDKRVIAWGEPSKSCAINSRYVELDDLKADV